MIRGFVSTLREEPQPLLFGMVCGFLSSPGQTFFISLFVGSIATELGLSAAKIGSLYLFATFGAALLLPAAGHWIDRLDLRVYTAAIVVGLAAACATIASAGGALSLMAAFLMLRLSGQGLMTHVAITSVARYFRNNRGRALSLVALGFPMAEGTLPAIAVALLGAVGWRMGYAVVGAVLIGIALPVVIALIWRKPVFYRPPGWQSSQPAGRAMDGIRIVIRTRFFWCALPVLIFLPYSSTALVFHIQAIADLKDWPDALIALGFTGYAAGHALGLPFAGALVDRFGARRMLSLMIVPALFGIATLGLFDAPPALFLFLALLGLSSGLVQTSTGAVWAEVYGVEKLGTIRSFAVMLMVAGTSLGPVSIGYLLDSGVSVAWVAADIAIAGAVASLLAALEAYFSKPRT